MYFADVKHLKKCANSVVSAYRKEKWVMCRWLKGIPYGAWDYFLTDCNSWYASQAAEYDKLPYQPRQKSEKQGG